MATLERQVMLTKQYILGELSLSSKEEMLESLQSELDKNDAIGYPREKFYVFNIVPEGYTAFHYSADIEKMTNLPIDNGNYSKTIGKIIPLLIQLIKDGYGPQLKTVDYETLLEGIDFKPTSDTF